MPEVDQIDKHPIETVVAVYERQVESFAAAKERRKGELRFLGTMLNHGGNPGLVEELQTAVGEPTILVRIDDDMVG